MSPEDRNAVICSGGGAIGGAVARAFARKGARVFLAGCAPTKREAAAEETRPVGGVASTAWVDAFDERRGEENVGA
jgi:NAD(P)-dependent dehydrogenase (short-subunit alcohol dehydrogenase family)